MPTRKESAFAAIARTSSPFAHQLAHPLSVPARVYRLGLDLDSIHEIPVARTAFNTLVKPADARCAPRHRPVHPSDLPSPTAGSPARQIAAAVLPSRCRNSGGAHGR